MRFSWSRLVLLKQKVNFFRSKFSILFFFSSFLQFFSNSFNFLLSNNSKKNIINNTGIKMVCSHAWKYRLACLAIDLWIGQLWKVPCSCLVHHAPPAASGFHHPMQSDESSPHLQGLYDSNCSKAFYQFKIIFWIHKLKLVFFGKLRLCFRINLK